MSALTFETLSAELTQALRAQDDTPPNTTARCTLGRDKVMVLVEYPKASIDAEPIAAQTLDWLEQSLRNQFDTKGLPESAADLSEGGSEVSVQLFLKHADEAKPFTMRSFIWKVEDGFDDLFGSADGDAIAPVQATTTRIVDSESQPIFQEANGGLSNSSLSNSSPNNRGRQTTILQSETSTQSESFSIAQPQGNSLSEDVYSEIDEPIPAELEDDHLALEIDPIGIGPEPDFEAELGTVLGTVRSPQEDIALEADLAAELEADLATEFSRSTLFSEPTSDTLSESDTPLLYDAEDSEFSLPGEAPEIASDELNLPTLEIPGAQVPNIAPADAAFFNIEADETSETDFVSATTLDLPLPENAFEYVQTDAQLDNVQEADSLEIGITQTEEGIDEEGIDEEGIDEVEGLEVDSSELEGSELEGSELDADESTAEPETLFDENVAELETSESAIESNPVVSEAGSDFEEVDIAALSEMNTDASDAPTADLLATEEPDSIETQIPEEQFEIADPEPEEQDTFAQTEDITTEDIAAEDVAHIRSSDSGAVESDGETTVDADEQTLPPIVPPDTLPPDTLPSDTLQMPNVLQISADSETALDDETNLSQLEEAKAENFELEGSELEDSAREASELEGSELREYDPDAYEQAYEESTFEEEETEGTYEESDFYYLEEAEEEAVEEEFEDVAAIDDGEVQREHEQWQQQTKKNPWIFVGAAGFLLAGVVGFIATRPCTFGSSCDRIQVAELTSEEAIRDLRTDTSLDSVLEAKKQIKRAISTLSPIPVWSPYYREAQDDLPEYRSQVAALDLVADAQGKAYRAALASQDPPHPVDQWRKIANDWLAATEALKAVPADSAVRELADSKLAEYRANRATILVRIDAEERAEVGLRQAQNSASLGTKQLETASSAEDWEAALSSWETAVDSLSDIPQGTNAYAEAQKLLPEYTETLNEVRSRAVSEISANDSLVAAKQLAVAAQRADAEEQGTIAVENWRRAYSTLQDIPERTLAYAESKALLQLYGASLAKAENNVQVALRFQTIEPNFFIACGITTTQICTYSVRNGKIRMDLFEGYDEVVERSITPPDQRAASNIAGGALQVISPQFVDNGNQLLRNVTLLGTETQIPIELYDAKGELLATYRPDLDGFTR